MKDLKTETETDNIPVAEVYASYLRNKHKYTFLFGHIIIFFHSFHFVDSKLDEMFLQTLPHWPRL